MTYEAMPMNPMSPVIEIPKEVPTGDYTVGDKLTGTINYEVIEKTLDFVRIKINGMIIKGKARKF